jgi:hypothetical protein
MYNLKRHSFSILMSRDSDRAALGFRLRSSAAFCPHCESTTPSIKAEFRNYSFGTLDAPTWRPN